MFVVQGFEILTPVPSLVVLEFLKHLVSHGGGTSCPIQGNQVISTNCAHSEDNWKLTLCP
jgi:hypothetical protein